MLTDKTERMEKRIVSGLTAADIRAAVAAVLEREQLPQIVQLGHPVLRQAAVPYDGQLGDAELRALLELMRRTMHAAPGVGLAAPQIGIPVRLAVMEDPATVGPEVADARERQPLPYFAAINPQVRAIGEHTASFFEGCLSFAGYQAVVERHRKVELQYLRPDGTAMTEEFTGWPARIVQHETDHLDGVVYIDKAIPRSLCTNAEYSSRWAQPTIERARRELRF
ncbi:MAG TPA: peptide deformylase [Arthrobacter sp.]|nr:peptide deformylase [Arthrobacter sp.]